MAFFHTPTAAAASPNAIRLHTAAVPKVSASQELLRTRSAQVATYLGKHSIANLLMTLTRNKNQNFVCYQAVLQRGGWHFAPKNPVSVFWLDIEPSYQAAARKAGRTHDRCELNCIERQYAYGVTAIRRGGSATHPTEFAIAVAALPKRVFVLRVVNDAPRLIGTIATRRAVLQRVHVNEKSGLLRPTVQSVFLVGNCVVSGKLVVEEIKNA